MTKLKDTQFDEIKAKFYGKASNILIYKTDKKRNLPTDTNMINKYRDEVFEQYNAMAALAASVFDDLDQKEQEKITNSFERFYKPRLIEALNFIGFIVETPKNFELLELDCIGNLPADGASGGKDDDDDLEFEENESFKAAMLQHMQPNDDDTKTQQRSTFEPNPNSKSIGLKTDARASRVVTNSKFRGMNPNDFDNMFSLDPKRIAANRNNSQNLQQKRVAKPSAFLDAYTKPKPTNSANFQTNSNFGANCRTNSNYRRSTMQNDPTDWD